MDEKAVVEFISQDKKIHVDLEIPLGITANDLVLSLNEADRKSTRLNSSHRT